MPAFSLEDFRAKSPDKPKFTVNDALGLLQRIGPLGGLLSPGTVKGHTLDPSLGGNLLDTAHGAARSVSAGLLGGGVDIAAQLMSVPNYLGAPTPNFYGMRPVGGSEWLGKQMESLGLLRPRTGSANEIAGELLGAMSPKVVGAVGSKVEDSIRQGAQNLTVPNKLHPEFGGLNMFFHGTRKPWEKYDADAALAHSKSDAPYGMLFGSDSPKVASGYATSARGKGQAGVVYPFKGETKNPLTLDAKGSNYKWIDVPADLAKKLDPDKYGSPSAFSFVSPSGKIEQQSHVSMDINTLAALAKKAGYDGLEIKNVADFGSKRSQDLATTFAYFDPLRQTKSVFDR